jgi:hypothetical protein
MLKFNGLFFLLLFSLPALSKEISAYRPLNVDDQELDKKFLDSESEEKSLWVSSVRSARYYSGDEKNFKATSWRSLQDMHERFESIRDERFLADPGQSGVLRRISWLYPADGCWARAALFNRQAFRKFIPIPSKVYAFGNLRVKTPNSRRGAVGWWYHVAPIVRVGAENYVLDPSIEATRPLLLREWLERMGDPKKIRVSICGSGTYNPGDNCSKESDGVEISAMNAQKFYLSLEKQELNAMRRDSERELGEHPPWR